MVNQTSLTGGESAPVRKAEGSFAVRNYSGRADSLLRLKKPAGSSRYEKIVNMIRRDSREVEVLCGK